MKSECSLVRFKSQTQIASLNSHYRCDLNITCWTLISVNALVDNGNNSTSPNTDGNKRLYEDEISDQLLNVPTGHHYLILYPNIETMRKVYSSYVKKQLEEQPDSVILFLSYYDTTDNVRDVLAQRAFMLKNAKRKVRSLSWIS